MRYTFFWILLCHFCFTSLFADEDQFVPPDEPFVSSLVKTQNLLSTMVDSVSAISGDWIQSETDFVILGPEPLILNRYYTGDHSHSDRLGYNWDFNRPHKLMIDVQEKGTQHAQARARLYQASGIATIHESHVMQHKLAGKILPLILSRSQGLNNCRGEISAKTNLHNTIIQLDWKGKHCVAISGSGHLTYYTFSFRQNLREWKEGKIGVGHYKQHILDHYRPIYERKPNGNTIQFGRGIISAANSSSTQIYSTLKFHNDGIDTLKVQASDGKTAIFKFAIYDHLIPGTSDIKIFEKHRFYLSQASFSHKPTETYEYTHHPPPHHTEHLKNPLLKAKRRPDGRFQEVDYYHQGLNHVDMRTDKVNEIRKIELDEDDFRIHRIRAVKAPVGHDATPIITQRFIYEADEHYQPVKKKHQAFSGRTKVYDAYLRKTVYEYNKEHRPVKIKRYDDNRKLYAEECYIWDDVYAYPRDFKKNKKRHHTLAQSTILPSLSESIAKFLPNKILDFSKKEQIEQLIKACLKSHVIQTGGAGNLLGKYLKDAHGQILYARFFDYDNRGNILRDRFYGNLKGIQPQHIELDFHNQPKDTACEYYEKRFTYSGDQFNLLESEEEDNGKGILYDYYPNSDLVAAKYVTENNTIRFRQFFHYDSTATLIKMIKDDGCKEGEEDWSGISERHITYIHPRNQAPFGLPESIEHKYVDFETQTERLLKKIWHHYSREGYLLQQDHYDANNQLRYSLYWDYDAHGNVIREVNALGHEIIKNYDANDNLICERGPRPEDCKEYTYDFSNRLISVKTKEEGKSWVIYYKYDLVGNRIAEIDRYGNETQYEYDAFNRLVRTIYPAIIGQADRPHTETLYDCLDHPIAETDARGFVTKKSYNVRGKITSIQHPDGQLEQSHYHLDGTLAKKIASNGTTTHFTYDCFGKLLSEKAYSASGQFLYETHHTYNSFHKTSSTDAEGITTYFTYDGAGRLIKTTCLDKIEIYEYDPLGRLLKKKEPFDHDQVKVSCTEYDLLDRIIEERVENEKGQVLKRVSYRYDLLGNRTHVIEETAAGLSQQVTFYNLDKKPIKKIDPEGRETHITYDAVRNSLGQLVLQTTTTDPIGRQILITYDAMEHPTSIKQQDLNGVIWAYQELFYDGVGNVVRIIDHVIAHGQEIRCIETSFAYQEMGKLTCLIQAEGLPEQQITRTAYNAYGQKEKILKGDGICLFSTYDPLGRLETYSSSDHSIHYRYQYNARHQIVHIEDSIQNTHSYFHYDARGRLITETLSTGLSMNYIYDLLDRVTNLTLPDSSQVLYKYDALNIKQIERYKQQQMLYRHCYDAFDLAGLTLRSTDIHQQTSSINYDVHKHPLAVEQACFKQNEAQYDPAGRLRHCRWQDLIGTREMHFDYDHLDHLIREEGHIYSCDSLHNRLTKNQVPHLSNGLHQLIHNGEYTFTYDQAGNLKRKEKENAMITYDYDASDRLTSIHTGTESIRYLYDAFNRRVAKIKGVQTIRYLYIGQDEIGAVDEAGNIQELRVLGKGHGAEIGASVAIELRDRIFAPQHDFQGNIVSLTDLSGHPVEVYRYTAFGEISIFNSNGEKLPASQMNNPWRFASKRTDEESGFIYFGRRYYDPINGRWITADPAGLTDGPNLYAYLHHCPIQAFDLYGLQEEPYYPLQNVDYHDKAEPPKKEQTQPNQDQDVPLGFIEKKKGKKDRMFFCGLHQIAELGISSINGIMNTLKDASATARALSEMAADHYVTFVYNKSHGFIADVVRSFFELYFYMQTEAVKNQQARWDAYFNFADSTSLLFHLCHSEGAIITRNALMTYPEELRKRIIVIAIAPGAYIDKKYAYQVIHYRSTRDIVPLFDFVGAYRCRESTVVLKPHPDAPLFDHSISSPTYQEPLEYQVDNYMKKFGGATCPQFE